MSDVLITPASSKIEFKDASSNIDGTVKLDSDGNLELTSNNGISFGDTSSDVFIGNGTDNVDLKFEADGSITGTSGVTLTLGSSNSNVKLISNELSINATSGVITATTFSGNLNGTLTVTDESSDTTCFPVFVTSSTGNRAPKTGSNLSFNSSSGRLTTTQLQANGNILAYGNIVGDNSTDISGIDDITANSFTGNLIGNVVGLGETSLGLGYFKYTAAGSSANQLVIANVAIGYSAGHMTPSPVSNTSHAYNVFVGTYAGRNQTTGQFNTYVGMDAGGSNLTGDRNVAIGLNAGYNNYFGSQNIYIGASCYASANNTNNECVIGSTALNKFKIPGLNFTLKDNGSTLTQGHVLTVDSNGEAGFDAATGGTTGITGTTDITNLASGQNLMCGIDSGERIHLKDDGTYAVVQITTGENRTSGFLGLRTGHLDSTTSLGPYRKNSGQSNNSAGQSIKIDHVSGEILIGSQSGDFNIGSSAGSIFYNGFKFKLDGRMDCCGEFNVEPNILIRRRGSGDAITFNKESAALMGIISVNYTNSTTAYNTSGSDRTLKKNFEDWTEEVLPYFKSLNPQKFNFIEQPEGTDKMKGYIAQDLVDKFPEAYPKHQRTDKYWFNPSGMTVYLMKALQEEILKREALEARIKALES